MKLDLSNATSINKLFFASKIAFTARYGFDTITVALAQNPEAPPAVRYAEAIGDFVVLDLFLFAVWNAASYEGNSKALRDMRPFAALLAWALFGAMLFIGWEAGGLVSLIARIGGGGLLLYDTIDVIRGILAGRTKKRKPTFAEKLAKRRERAFQRAYAIRLAFAPIRMLKQASRQLASDLEADFERIQIQMEAATAKLSANGLHAPTLEDFGSIVPFGDGMRAKCNACDWSGEYASRGLAERYLKSHYSQKHQN